MEKFISTILTVLLAIWVLRWVFAIVGPWLMGLLAKHILKKAGLAGNETGGKTEKETASAGKTSTMKGDKWWKPDEVILKPHRRQGERLSDILGGEYVDYEDVETGG